MKNAVIQEGVYGAWRIAWGTHVGRVRDTNEDGVAVCADESGNLLLVVADGLGGQAAGEVASGLAVSTLEEAFAASKDPARELENWVRKAHEAILGKAQEDPSRSGMSTTCSALVVSGDAFRVSHVGDTRIYKVGSKLEPLTQDHTWEASITQLGDSQYMPAAAKHVLTRCLGTRNSFAIDSAEGTLRPEDRGFFLCSDGLYGQVPEELCLTMWGEEPRKAVRHLIQGALDSGGPDNISVIVAHREN